MAEPNALEKLRDLVAVEHPQACLKIERPLREDGVWTLEIDLGPHVLAVEWSAAGTWRGFAVTRCSDDTLFQRGGDAHCVTESATLAQIRGLLAEKLPQAA